MSQLICYTPLKKIGSMYLLPNWNTSVSVILPETHTILDITTADPLCKSTLQPNLIMKNMQHVKHSLVDAEQ
jgi:hypothetical protein